MEIADAFALAIFSGNFIFIFAIQKSLRAFLDCLFTRKAVAETTAVEMLFHMYAPLGEKCVWSAPQGTTNAK